MKIRLPQLPFLTRQMLKYGNTLQLRLRLSAAADVVGVVRLKVITRHGMAEINVNTTADGAINSDTLGVDDFPIMVSATDADDTYAPNQCWANIELEIGEEEWFGLCSGFIHEDKSVSYPNTSMADAMPAHGRIVEVDGANPAAGAECLIPVPVGEIWQLKTLNVRFDCDSNVADRVPHFVFTGPGNMLIHTWAAAVFAADEGADISCAQWGLISGISNADDFRIELPSNIWLPPESTITTETQGIQVGDDYGVPCAVVEKYFAQA